MQVGAVKPAPLCAVKGDTGDYELQKTTGGQLSDKSKETKGESHSSQQLRGSVREKRKGSETDFCMDMEDA